MHHNKYCLLVEFAQRVLDQGPTPRNGNKTDQAHPPIHPTKYTNSLQVGHDYLFGVTCIISLYMGMLVFM